MLKNRLLPQSFTADDDLKVMGSAPQQTLGPVMRCLLWNILKAKRSNWLSDFSHLIADRDIVMLQEAVFNAPSDPLFTKSERFEWVMARSFKDPLSQKEHGVKTGSSACAIERHFYMSPHTEPVMQTQKLILTTLYPLANSDEQLLVLNMHAINFVSVKKYAQQLKQLSVALGQHTGPVILGGDFNTWTPVRHALFLDVTRRAGLEEANMKRRTRMTHMNQHLDHLFYRGLTLRCVESLPDYYSSDHAPITATFEFPEHG